MIGGASTAQQCMKAGLVDELQIGSEPTRLEKLRVMESATRTDIRFRVLK